MYVSTCAHKHTCMWKLEAEVWCFLQLLSSLTCTPKLTVSASLAYHLHLGSSALPTEAYHTGRWPSLPSVYMGAGDVNPVITLMQHMLYCLNHLPSPRDSLTLIQGPHLCGHRVGSSGKNLLSVFHNRYLFMSSLAYGSKPNISMCNFSFFL